MTLHELALQALRENYASITTGIQILIAVAAIGLLWLAKKDLTT